MTDQQEAPRVVPATEIMLLNAEVARLRGALEDIAMDIESDSRARPWLLAKVRAALTPLPDEEAK